LVATLTRSLSLRERLQSDSMRRCLGAMSALPSLPKTCAALNHLLRDDNAPLRDVTAIIEGDVAMAAKVLQLVNSSFFGLPRQVISVDQAIRYLGLNSIRSLVLANALFEELAGGDVTRLEAEQARALMLARFARRFPLSARQAEIAATAALLHNVGQLALISRLPSEHQANQDYAREHGVSLEQAESARLGVTHAEIGAYLLSLWGLPFEVIEAVGSQAEPAEALSALDATAVIWLVKGLLAESLSEEPRANPRIQEVARRFNVSAEVEARRQELAVERFERMAS
jgi:HD-like signal output (HDOD) protein